MEFIERGSQRSRSLPVLRLFQGKEAKRPAPSDEASIGQYFRTALFMFEAGLTGQCLVSHCLFPFPAQTTLSHFAEFTSDSRY